MVAAPPPKPLPPTAAGTLIVVKPAIVLKRGEIVNRTYRRSAETTGVTVRVTPLGKGAGVGTKATDPGPTIGVNCETYHCN